MVAYPSRLALGTLLLIGFVGGIVSGAALTPGWKKANTEEFCISCHEMQHGVSGIHGFRALQQP